MRALLWVLGLSVTMGSARADDAAVARAAAGVLETLQTETLPNGLRVYLLPVPGAQTVSTMVAYKVGSADEDKDQTGLAHYLEHLLFKGTNKLMPGDIDRATQRNGGRNNAYTNADMTVYHFDFASDRWEQALEIEADRMRNVQIDEKHEFEQEKGAVVAELKGGEDRPWGLEYKAILPMLYSKQSPYAHPVIGEEAHVRGVTAETIKRYYDKWYHPNNAALVIVGGFDVDQTRAKIRTLFGSIPPADLPDRKPEPAAAPRTTPLRREMPSKFDVPRLMVGFNTVKAGEPDDVVLTLMQNVLSGGRTSRLYKRLVEGDRVASGASFYSSTGRYSGWAALSVELLKGKDRAATEKAVFEELNCLANEPISEAELARAKRSEVADFIYSREDVHGLADLIAQTVTLHDIDYLRTYLDQVLAVSAADIQRVARKYLDQSTAAVLWSVPAEAKAGGAKPETREAIDQPRANRDNPPLAAAPAGRLAAAKRTVLPNGLTLITLENPGLPVVTARAAVKNVLLREPAQQAGIATLTGDMLVEGTSSRTGDEIALAIESVGGSLDVSRDGASLKVLAPDTKLGLELMLDCLMRPYFPEEAFERVREQQLSAIAEATARPQTRAAMKFQELVYGEHPFGRPGNGTEDVVAKLTVADCQAFHQAAFVPNETILVVVGAFQTTEIVDLVTKLTADWKPNQTPPPPPAAPPSRSEPTVSIQSVPGASQTHVFIGHLGVTRSHPDYYTLLVLDNVLGTGPGFTDRLSANLRDRQGLAYTVTAQITRSASDQPGAFTGYIGTFADKFIWVREGFLAEIKKIRNEEPSLEEVESAKQYLLGGLPFRTETNAGLAGQLLAAEKYNLGFDFLEQYRAKVAAVTPAMVHEAARTHLKPERIVLVAVGPVTADGKPIQPAAAEKE